MPEETLGTSLESYVMYQRKIAEHHVIPTLRELGLLKDGLFLDVGCGTGGFSLSLAALCDIEGHGFDVDQDAVYTAGRMAEQLGLAVRFEVVDLLEDTLPNKKYSLLLLRDVIEHVSNPSLALRKARSLVSDTGALYLTFPPWLGPYAGHQHNARSVMKFLPYLHAVSPKAFLALAERLEGTRCEWLADEQQILTNRLTIPRFERFVAENRWTVQLKRTYLIRPALMRLGLPAVSNGPFGRIPLLGELLTTGCEYVLRPS